MAKSSAPNTSKLTATVRERTGKGASRQARRDGKVPAVLYGHGTDPQHLEIDARAFATVLRHAGTNAVLSLEIDGTEQLALTRALEIHPIRRSIQHADLLVVKRGEKVLVEVNIVVEGEAVPGTLVTQDGNYVEIEAEALSIPEQIIVSVEGLEAGTQILASQLDLGEATLVSDPEALIVNIVVAPTAAEMEAESGGASLEEQAEAEEETAAEAPAEAE